MEATPPRRWRGQTHDDRILARRARLLQAGFELLGTDGAAGVTMRGVCRRAGLSPRYFYESFSGTDALTVAVYDQCNAELVAAISHAAAGHQRLPDTVAAAVDAAARYFEADARRVRILLAEPLSSDLLGGRRADVLPGLLTGLIDSAGVPGPPRLTAEHAMNATALSGALAALVLDWANGRLVVSRADLARHATNLVLTSFGHPPAGASTTVLG